MNVEELRDLVPRLLESQFAGQHRKVGFEGLPEGLPEVGGWVVEADGVYAYLFPASGGPGFLWIQCGVAHAIPRSSELAHYVAAASRHFVTGRTYMAYGDELAYVVVDETVFAPALSFDHQPSIQELFDRLSTSMAEARKMRQRVLADFGGVPFTGDDWMMLSLG